MENMVRGWRLDGCSTLEWMQTGKASKTALRVGIRRAAHQVIDNPRVLDDPVADLDRAADRLLGVPPSAPDMTGPRKGISASLISHVADSHRYDGLWSTA